MRRSWALWLGTVAAGLACAGCNGPRTGTPGLEPPSMRMSSKDAGAGLESPGSAGSSASTTTGGSAGKGGSFGNATAPGSGGSPPANLGGMSGTNRPAADAGSPLADQDGGALEP